MVAGAAVAAVVTVAVVVVVVALSVVAVRNVCRGVGWGERWGGVGVGTLGTCV